MDTDLNRTTSYQHTLRALGAFLEREPACHISLIEVIDGFFARFHRRLSDPDPLVLHFNRETLGDQLEKLILLRERVAESETRYQGLWANFPKGHQDFFRALGFELDQQSARWVLIDELEDSLTVSYRLPDEDTGQWRKRVVVMGIEDIEKVLRAAVERRQRLTGDV